MGLVPFHLYRRVISNGFRNFLRIYTHSSAVLGLTYKCQCKCVHCSAGHYKKEVKNELATKEWFRILDQIYDLGVPRINLSGGEALLREDVFEIINYASKKFVVILESNGQLLTGDRIKYLKKANVSSVAVSVDSYDPSVHDNLRNLKWCFQGAIEGISNVVKSKIPCILSTYITSQRANRRNIENIMALAKRLGVLAVRVMPPRPVGSFSCHVNSLLSIEKEKEILQLINPYRAYFKGMPAPKQCGIFHKATFYVSPYAEIQLCPYLPLSFGNIREQNLSEVLERMWNHSIFKIEDRSCLILNEDFRNKYILQNGHNTANRLLPIEV